MHRRLLLASRSPRRRQLLDQAGLTHDVIVPDVDDGDLRPGGGSPAAWVTALAYLKARAATSLAHPDDVILAADTVCVRDGQIIGQARDAADASRMILSFVGRDHDVLTGVCVLVPQTRDRMLRHDLATVRLGGLSPAMVDEYVASGEWRGKAGAYNYFERQAAGWPLSVAGDPQTVVGLPIRLVRRMLCDIDTSPRGEERPRSAAEVVP